MEGLLTRLVLLLIGFGMMMSPLAVLIVFLRRRERQESLLRGIVVKELNSPALRGLFAVNVRCGLFTPHGTITIDLLDCSKEQMLRTLLQLSDCLPMDVHLVANGVANLRSRSTLALDLKWTLSSVPTVN